MQHIRLENALKKAGFKIQTDSKRHSATNGNKVVRWREQDGSAICVNCGKLDDPSDSQIDYFPGFYARTIKEAVAHLG